MEDELFLAQEQFETQQNIPASIQEHCKSLATFIDLLEDGLVETKPLISHTMSINDVQQAYKTAHDKDVFGILLNFLPKPENVPTLIKTPSSGYIPAKKEHLHVGIISAGTSTQNKLVPILSKVKNLQIETAVDKNIVKSLNIAQIYGARKTTINEQELFDDENINVIFMNNLDRLRCQQAITAMEKGKAVFLEKPMATDLEQLHILNNYLQKNTSGDKKVTILKTDRTGGWLF